MADLTDVRVLVTGGTSGLGRAMAAALAEDGARVAVTGRDRERLREAADAHPNGLALELDVRDPNAVERVVDEVWTTLGGIELLVNNAGLGMRSVNPQFMSEPRGFWTVPVEGFRAVVETNLTGYFLVARAVVPRMLDLGGGRVVNISMNHSTMNRRGFVPYGPSRAGAEALSRIMAADLADSPVRVNTLLPGGVTATGMVPDGSLPPGVTVLPPEVMAAPIRFLASPAAAQLHDARIVAVEFDAWLREQGFAADGPA